MIPLCDRRSACLLAQSLLLSSSSLQLPPSAPLDLPRLDESAAKSTTNTAELAQFVAAHTPRAVLEAVRDSGGKFLYRGEESKASCYQEQAISATLSFSNPLVVRTCDPPPDVLLAKTYGYDDLALKYFQNLEASLKDSFPVVAKPSSGHIATSDPSEAAKWGSVVSVWPLEPQLPNTNNSQYQRNSFSYVWPRSRSVFYDEKRNILKDDVNALVTNRRLKDALEAKGGREVLFACFTTTRKQQASAAFLTIPAELDSALREELERIEYGLE